MNRRLARCCVVWAFFANLFVAIRARSVFVFTADEPTTSKGDRNILLLLFAMYGTRLTRSGERNKTRKNYEWRKIAVTRRTRSPAQTTLGRETLKKRTGDRCETKNFFFLISCKIPFLFSNAEHDGGSDCRHARKYHTMTERRVNADYCIGVWILVYRRSRRERGTPGTRVQ